MAIIPQIPGLTVTVNIEGTPATEYEPPEELPLGVDNLLKDLPQDQPHVCRYIESVSGQNFSIQAVFYPPFQTAPTYDYLYITASVDGTFISKSYAQIKKAALVEPITLSISSLNTRAVYGAYFKHPLQFSPVSAIEETASDIAKEDLEAARNMGTIMVKVYQAKNMRSTAIDGIPPNNEPDFPDDDVSIAEKAFKGRALTHAVKYSSILPMEKFPQSGRRLILGSLYSIRFDRMPLCTFCFQYRSRVGLRHEMVLPPLKTNHAVDRDVTKMSVEELQQLVMDSRVSKGMPFLKRELDEKLVKSPAGEPKAKKRVFVQDVIE